MILGKVISGPWNGAGLGSYEAGTDFNCNSTICYGVTRPGEQKPGAVHQAFVNLQRAINRWSGKANFTPISTDGKLGHATVSALQKAGTASMATLPMGVKQIAQRIFAESLTKENTAMNALALTESLNSAADKLEAAGSLPPALPGPSAPRPSSSSDLPTAPSPMAPAGKKSNALFWILGGVAVVATAGIATAVVMKKKPKPTRRAGGRRSAHAY